MRHLLMAALGAATLLAPLPAAAQTSLSAYDAVREALVAVWDELPLSVRNAALVDGTPRGFGQFERRSGNSFKPDEAVTVYAELYGYGVTSKANGGYIRELSADLALVDATGAVRANQIGFWTSSEEFDRVPLEMHLSFSATLSAFPAGEYLLRFTVHDKAFDEQTS
ncbi:MAG: hypothetical protein ABIY37_01220, partial [Devosia sp.]